jgi:hypothetical protein
MSLSRFRRALLWVGYRLPSCWQRYFHERLYDGPRPESGKLLLITRRDGPEGPVRFEFSGGCRDGQVYEGNLANPFYWASDHGALGTRFLIATDEAVDDVLSGKATGPILDQEYEVVENRFEDGTIYVRAEARP